jgi:hypothetical protein
LEGSAARTFACKQCGALDGTGVGIEVGGLINNAHSAAKLLNDALWVMIRVRRCVMPSRATFLIEWLATGRESFACELEPDVISWEGIQESRPVPFLLLGLVTIGWAGFSLISGKGYYKGCPPGGYDRATHPFNFWVPTMIILGIGVCMMLIFVGVIPLPSR